MLPGGGFHYSIMDLSDRMDHLEVESFKSKSYKKVLCIFCSFTLKLSLEISFSFLLLSGGRNNQFIKIFCLFFNSDSENSIIQELINS